MNWPFTGTFTDDVTAIVRASEGRCPKKVALTQAAAFLRNDEAPAPDFDDFDAERQ